MGIVERLKGQPVRATAPLGSQPAPAPVPTAEPKEGESVDLGDSAKALYRDRAGSKLGGGAPEGQSYRSTVAENARQSVDDSRAKELAELEKALEKL